MTKITIALCILIAIASGAQGASIISTIAKQVGNGIIIFIQLAKSAESAMQAGFLAMIKSTEILMAEGIGNAQTIVIKWEEELLKLPGPIDVIRSCTTSSVDLRKIAAAYLTNVTTCINTAVQEMRSDYISVATSMEIFVKELTDEMATANVCETSEVASCLSTVFSILAKMTNEIASQWDNLSAKSSSLITAMAEFPVRANVCAASITAETLAAASIESSTAIAKCVADKAINLDVL